MDILVDFEPMYPGFESRESHVFFFVLFFDIFIFMFFFVIIITMQFFL